MKKYNGYQHKNQSLNVSICDSTNSNCFVKTFCYRIAKMTSLVKKFNRTGIYVFGGEHKTASEKCAGIFMENKLQRWYPFLI